MNTIMKHMYGSSFSCGKKTMKASIRPAILTIVATAMLTSTLLFFNSFYFSFSSEGDKPKTILTETSSQEQFSHEADLTKPFFKRPKTIANTGIENWNIKVADINEDGLPDIVTTWNGPPENPTIGVRGISILINRGDETFSETVLNFTTDCNIGDVDVADFDGDGNLDIMFTYNEYVWYYGAPVNVNGTVNIMWNDGNCNFSKPEQVLWLGPGIPYSPDNWINLDVGCGDFDKDGDVDFVVGGNCGWVSFYKNDGTGHFTLAKKIYDYGNYTWDFAVADFDNDGWLDFVVASENATYLKLNNHKDYCFDYGPGIRILQHIPFGFEIGPMGPAAIAPIDYNNDGKEDIILMCLHTIYLLMNYGNLSFVPIPVSYAFDDVCLLGKGLETDDLNQDGWEDLLIGSGGGKIYLLSNNRTFILISCPIDKLVYLKGSIFFGLPPKWWGKCIIIGNITFKAVPLEPLDRVEFYVNGKLVENDTEPPYEWTWNIRNFLPKWYTVDAVAYRQNGDYGGRYRLEVLKIL